MSNGRSFSRKNIKGSPGKSQRRARQRQQALVRAQLNVKAATTAAIESLRDSLDEKLPAFVEQMTALGFAPDQAEKALREAVEAQSDDADSV